MSSKTPTLIVTEDTSEPQDRTESLAVPPIRSLSSRDPVHFPSKSNLQPATSTFSDNHGLVSRRHDDPSTTITHAISHLESLLEEVGRLAQLVQVPEETRKNPQEKRQPPDNGKRRPSGEIVSKGVKYLEAARPTRQPTVRFVEPPSTRLERQLTGIAPDQVVNGDAVIQHVHGESEGTKAALALPVVSSPNTDIGLEYLVTPKLNELRSRSTNDLKGPKSRRNEALRRPSSHANLKQDIEDYVGKHGEVPITQQTVYSIRGPSKEKKRNIGASSNPTPDIVLNDSDLPENKEEAFAPVEPTFGPPKRGHPRHFSQMFGVRSREASIDMAHEQSPHGKIIDLRRKTHVDLVNKPDEFEVHHSCEHKPVARNWPDSRKRFTAAVVCINTACLGLLIGIYAGEVPAIQYVIADFSHWTVLGNVFLYCGLAISTLLFWPLALLHGRKPYILAGLALALGLQIPQGVVVTQWRTPDVVTWRLILLLCRALTGFAFGFVTINLQASLLDVFGASLQSRHPHGELVDPYDVRRHGGGMGLWLGAWSWCTIGPISLGFVIGAFIINTATVQWGFWTGLFLLTFVLLLNFIAPETRRSAFRRTIAEMTGEAGSFSRVTRGEIKMHLSSVGPFW